jgi:hypothetical protein
MILAHIDYLRHYINICLHVQLVVDTRFQYRKISYGGRVTSVSDKTGSDAGGFITPGFHQDICEVSLGEEAFIPHQTVKFLRIPGGIIICNLLRYVPSIESDSLEDRVPYTVV